MKTKLLRVFRNYIVPVLIGIIVVIIARHFFQFAEVIGHSMDDTLYDGQRCFTARQFDRDNLDYGDIVCFNNKYTDGKSYIKRVVGKPGDGVIVVDGVLYVNNVETDYTFDYIEDGGIIQDKLYIIGDNEYFLMGDNRNQSTDSRVFGAVNASDITNLVLFVDEE